MGSVKKQHVRGTGGQSSGRESWTQGSKQQFKGFLQIYFPIWFSQKSSELAGQSSYFHCIGEEIDVTSQRRSPLYQSHILGGLHLLTRHQRLRALPGSCSPLGCPAVTCYGENMAKQAVVSLLLVREKKGSSLAAVPKRKSDPRSRRWSGQWWERSSLWVSVTEVQSLLHSGMQFRITLGAVYLATEKEAWKDQGREQAGKVHWSLWGCWQRGLKERKGDPIELRSLYEKRNEVLRREKNSPNVT